MLTKSKYGASGMKFTKLITRDFSSNVNKQRSGWDIKEETWSASIMR